MKNPIPEMFHLAHCFEQLGVMYAQEVARKLGETMLDALDCFGPDSPDDAAIKSEIWQRPNEAES